MEPTQKRRVSLCFDLLCYSFACISGVANLLTLGLNDWIESRDLVYGFTGGLFLPSDHGGKFFRDYEDLDWAELAELTCNSADEFVEDQVSKSFCELFTTLKVLHPIMAATTSLLILLWISTLILLFHHLPERQEQRLWLVIGIAGTVLAGLPLPVYVFTVPVTYLGDCAVFMDGDKRASLCVGASPVCLLIAFLFQIMLYPVLVRVGLRSANKHPADQYSMLAVANPLQSLGEIQLSSLKAVDEQTHYTLQSSSVAEESSLDTSRLPPTFEQVASH